MIDDLISRAGHDPEALGQLVESYRGLLTLQARSLLGPALGPRWDEEDLVQETLLEGFRSYGDFQGRSEPEFRAWLKAILRNRSLDLIRRSKAEKRDVDRVVSLDGRCEAIGTLWFEPTGHLTPASQRVLRGERALILARCLLLLPRDQRESIRLHHLEGLTIQEVAATMDRSIMSVAGLLKRGVRDLRRHLLQSGLGSEAPASG